MQLPLRDGDLMSESKYLNVLGVVAGRQQPQHRQHVRNTEVRQSQQHGQGSSPSDRQRSAAISHVCRYEIPYSATRWP
jgi:hypothetical protein